MPIQILKYHIEMIRSTSMPKGARILTVATQDNLPHVWVEADLSLPFVERALHAVPTGASPPSNMPYVGSCHNVEGWMVFHFYDGGEK